MNDALHLLFPVLSTEMREKRGPKGRALRPSYSSALASATSSDTLLSSVFDGFADLCRQDRIELKELGAVDGLKAALACNAQGAGVRPIQSKRVKV